MKYTVLAIAAFYAAGAQATWCNYFYDSECQQDSNGGTSYDCANHGSFGSGGAYVQCHGTKANQQECTISRCSGSTCANIMNTVKVSPGSGSSACISTGGTGPWYEEKFS